MTNILLRIFHSGGQLRVEVDTQETIGDLNNKIATKLNTDADNVLLSFDKKKYLNLPADKSIRQYRQFDDGAIVYVKQKTKDSNVTKNKEEPPKQRLSKHCNHPINGKCLHCTSFTNEMKSSKKDE